MTRILSHHLPSVLSTAQDTIDTLWSYLEAQGLGDYLGEAISQLEHSLQCAHRAVENGADDETVLGALLHDVGRFIPRSDYDKMPAMIAPNGTFVGRGSHEVLGENYLRAIGFSDKVCYLVGAHVWAKRYLTATVPGYYDDLSPSSKTTLKYQGGPFTPAQVAEASKDQYLQEKLAVRRWDDEAKVAGLVVPGLDAYKTMAVNSLLKSRSSFTLHGRTYRLPQKPTVAICVDGFDPEYLDQGIEDGVIPNLARIKSTGSCFPAQAAMPTFTNPNNCSIITGMPTAVHGISGNFYLDRETGEEKLVLDDTLLRGSTILEQASRRGVRVAAITAKDKLRRIIQHGLNPRKGDICFSSEYAGKCTLKENGIEDVESYIGRPAPFQYSGDLSIFVLDAGVKLLQEDRADLFYLTLSDFIQHKHAPGSKEANDFLSALDQRVGQLLDLGAVVALTGDHGMSDKSLANGEPRILFTQDVLEEKFGKGCARVIAPITDPFVKHHGALGSFVRVHVAPTRKSQVSDMMALLKSHEEVEVVLTGEEGAAMWQMPADVEGDIVVVSIKGAVLGSRKEEHDLENLKGHRLRSHGGLSEQGIPLMCSAEPAQALLEQDKTGRQWRNFDIFDVLLNYAE
ncbi:alkaline-phosphatase-like protein [Kockovaella imperatae]|uniref:Alkaline-phosphatase-like protein n=1 Tax=Kockovaella imperatae TaxID=4999 RepID=A0A1Y1UBA3_9TREE|nr:alkaline-phosphatase-like protein [Kockovaella imperatae]ORX35289.1 alkaline-phosphatase-like protein [Kockovaella imperatae]